MNETYLSTKEELNKAREALGFLQKVLYEDSISPYPCKAISREIINQALLKAGYEPVIDREVNLI